MKTPAKPEERARPLFLLSNSKPFARGGHRLCYLHPENPAWCIKVMMAHSPRIGRKDENLLEYRAYQELERHGDPAIWEHIPRCHGLVETDLGRGLVTDYLSGPDAAEVPNLKQRIDQGYDASCQKALEEFKAFLLKHLVRVGDMRPANLLVCKLPDSDDERIFIIDGLGDQHFIWWRSFRFLRPLKIRRKIRRLESRIREQIAALTVQQESQ